jgi:hypothetical protein
MSIPAILYGIGFLLAGGGERAGDYIKQDLGLSPLPQGE